MNRASMLHAGRRLALVAALLVAVFGAYRLMNRPPRVEVIRATRGPLVETIVASGRVQPTSRVSLAFESVGTVVAVAVSEGSTIRRGEVLVQLDDTSARAAVEQARAQLAQTEASLARLRGLGARVADAEVRNAEIALESARARERTELALEAGGATTQTAIDEAVRARRSAEAVLERAMEQSGGLSRGGDDVRVAAAARSAAQAALRSAQAQLDRTSLRAPFDGVVLARSVEPGQVVSPSGTVLEVASSGPLEIVVNVDESHLARLTLGQRALVSAESYADRRFDAEVLTIAPAVDPMRGTVQVELAIPSPPPYLRPDMTTSVEIETSRAASALVLPNEVVHDLASDRPWVFIVDRGVVRRRELRLGLRGDVAVAVASGIDDSTAIVRTPTSGISDGLSVRVKQVR